MISFSFFYLRILETNDHDGYDCAEFPTQSGQIKDKGVTNLKTIQNPYYGEEDVVNELESSMTANIEGNSLRENIKVTENPYYE